MLRMLDKPMRIVIARTDRIGDVVLSLPVFASLKKSFPDSQLVALVRDYTADVISSFHAVDRVVTYDPEEPLRTTRRKLREINADAILLLFPRFRIALAALLAGVPVRVGTAYRWYSFLFNEKVHEHRKDSVKSEAEYNLALAEKLGCKKRIFDTRIDVRPEALESAKEFLAGNHVQRFVAIHPGSGGSAYEWGQENFRELTRAVTDNFSLNVLITGTSSEHELCERISKGIPKSLNTAGQLSLLEFIALVSQAELFLSNSTGPLHLAASVGTPVIGIYPNNKPMTPARWAPLTDRKLILTPKDGSDDLSVIRVEEVVESVNKLLPVKAS